jgi:Na+/alanine symporter
MYVITEGLGKKYRWLAVFFCVAGVVGCLPMFQINQLVQAIRELIFLERGWIREDQATEFNLIAGLVLAATIASVILGGDLANFQGRITACAVNVTAICRSGVLHSATELVRSSPLPDVDCD